MILRNDRIPRVTPLDDLILELFFIKNLAFEDEKEIRFLLQDATAKKDIVSVKIEMETVIEAILFDPRMDHETYAYHKQFILDQFGISNISHSSLYDPERRFPHSKG